MRKFFRVSALISFIAIFALALYFPAIYALMAFGVIALLVVAFLKSFNIEVVQHSPPPPDDDASLEDDIRHHNYGYPGFGSHDDDRD